MDDELDIARSTLEWHLNHLTEQGFVAKYRAARNRVTLAVSRPDDVVELLREADPSFPDRMVDRFTCFVDRLLSE